MTWRELFAILSEAEIELQMKLFLSSIKQYASSSHKNLANLSLYASKMGVLSQVRSYMEVLL